MSGIRLKKGKIAIFLWLIAIFLGSIVTVETERYLLNASGVFYMSLAEGIAWWFLATLFILLVSSPVILLIYFLTKSAKSLGRLLSLVAIGVFVIAYFISVLLSKSYLEALVITGPYIFFTSISAWLYWKLEQ